MSWFSKLFSREEESPHAGEATEAEHQRHLEQSANPGSAPVVPPDTMETSADETEEQRREPHGEEKLEEIKGRDDQEGRLTREPPRSY